MLSSYFDPSATQEILDELRPLLCPSAGVAMKYAVQMLSWFLPLSGLPELADSTYKLWLGELMHLWEACSNNPFNWDDVNLNNIQVEVVESNFRHFLVKPFPSMSNILPLHKFCPYSSYTDTVVNATNHNEVISQKEIFFRHS